MTFCICIHLERLLWPSKGIILMLFLDLNLLRLAYKKSTFSSYFHWHTKKPTKPVPPPPNNQMSFLINNIHRNQNIYRHAMALLLWKDEYKSHLKDALRIARLKCNNIRSQTMIPYEHNICKISEMHHRSIVSNTTNLNQHNRNVENHNLMVQT